MDDLDKSKLESLLQRIQEMIDQTSPTCETPSLTYKCELCRDTGWITRKDEEGRLISEECKCWPARQAERLLKQSGLMGMIEEQTFDSFVTDTKLQSTLKGTAEHYLKRLLEVIDTDERKPWMYIGGNPGSGKTHICTAVCGELLKRGIGVKYMQWLTETRRLKSMVNDENFEDEVAEYINPQVLYIDDLMKQKYTTNPVFTEADIKIAFTILNARYFQNKPTIISSEWNLIEDLLSADEGVFSRVYERSKGFTIMIARRRDADFRLKEGT